MSTRGLTCIPNSAIVVPLPGPDIFHVKAHICREGLFAPLVDANVGSNINWYEIIGGKYCHQAIVLLKYTEPLASRFSWTVTSVTSALAMKGYRRQARLLITSHSLLLDADFTLEMFLLTLE